MTEQKKNAVYKLKPVYGTAQVALKMTNILNEGEEVIDEIVELDAVIHPESAIYGKNAIPLKSYNGYDMYGVIFRCKIIDTFISFNTRYPLMYLAVNYKKSVLYGSLLQVIISVNIPKEEKSKMKNGKFNNTILSGTFVQHVDTELEKTSDILKEKTINFKSIKQSRNDLVNLCTSDDFYKILQEAVDLRDQQRRDSLTKDLEQYEIPQQVYKMDELGKELLENDEVIFD